MLASIRNVMRVDMQQPWGKVAHAALGSVEPELIFQEQLHDSDPCRFAPLPHACCLSILVTFLMLAGISQQCASCTLMKHTSGICRDCRNLVAKSRWAHTCSWMSLPVNATDGCSSVCRIRQQCIAIFFGHASCGRRKSSLWHSKQRTLVVQDAVLSFPGDACPKKHNHNVKHAMQCNTDRNHPDPPTMPRKVPRLDLNVMLMAGKMILKIQDQLPRLVLFLSFRYISNIFI